MNDLLRTMKAIDDLHSGRSNDTIHGTCWMTTAANFVPWAIKELEARQETIDWLRGNTEFLQNDWKEAGDRARKYFKEIEQLREDIQAKDIRIKRLEESVLSLQEYKDKHEGLCK